MLVNRRKDQSTTKRQHRSHRGHKQPVSGDASKVQGIVRRESGMPDNKENTARTSKLPCD
jgi:hypothetical protein